MTHTAIDPIPRSQAEINQAKIAKTLHQQGTLSRAQIARAVHLTAPAISKLAARMIEQELIQEVGDMPGAGNRRSIGLRLKYEGYKVCAVKFARSRIQIGLFDLAGRPLQLMELPSINEASIPKAVTDVQIEVQKFINRDPTIIAVGIAVPGPYLRNEGRIALVTSMQDWRGINFIEAFSNAFSVPTFIEQDARAGALAQSLFVPAFSSTNLAYYLVGEGVGLGVIEQGNLINGAQGGATELGHLSIDVNGKPCECGNQGCLERYCSAVAIHQAMCQPPYVSHLADASNLNHAAACQLLFYRAEQGDELAQTLVEHIADYVGYGCVNIVNAFNPTHIVIGDIVAGAGQPLLERVRAIVAKRALPALNNQTHICLSHLPADATLMGAAAVAVSNFLLYPTYFARLVQERTMNSVGKQQSHTTTMPPANQTKGHLARKDNIWTSQSY